MLDEIHLKQFLDFKSGNIVGLDNNFQNVASSAHVFMIQSLRSSYKDVVHILQFMKLKLKLECKILSLLF